MMALMLFRILNEVFRMKEITCSNCGLTIRVLESSLGHIFHNLIEISGDVPWINYLCPNCKHLQFAHVQPGKLQSNDLDQSELRDGKSVSLLRFECAQKCLLSPVAVIR